MKAIRNCCLSLFVGSVLTILAGCASTPATTPAPQGGNYIKTPRMEKVWLAEGFDFNGYDTLYIAETKVDPIVKPNKDEIEIMEEAKRALRIRLALTLMEAKIFKSVLTDESQIKPDAKVLRMENIFTEYAKGGGGARYWLGLYGVGQPVIRLSSKISDADKPLFSFETRRNGNSYGARTVGEYMTDSDIQTQDISFLVKDLTDFMERTSKHLPPKKEGLFGP